MIHTVYWKRIAEKTIKNLARYDREHGNSFLAYYFNSAGVEDTVILAEAIRTAVEEEREIQQIPDSIDES